MTLRLADRLSAARQQRFVGRVAERTLFESALMASELPFCVLYIFGPGGIGKTTLLHEFARLCQQRHTPVIYIDGRNVEPSPEAFLAVLSLALGLQPPQSPIAWLAAQSHRHVILLDTYELLTPLDHWLRETLLLQLPEQVLIVLAGRQPPSIAWRTDPGWQTLMHMLALPNFSPEESRTYLAKRAIPSEQHQRMLEFTHGHPLALSLVVDLFAQRPNIHFRPDAAPDIIKTLLEQFVQKVPGPAHRSALEACALVRVTTEALLTEMLNMPDVGELFDWLRQLSFVEGGVHGLFPHDLTRDALVADLRWRNPDWYVELHRRARAYYARILQRTRGADQQRVMFDYVFLHRENPLVRPFLEWQESGSTAPDRMAPTDVPLLVAMVAQHEGSTSAQYAAHWLERQPRNVVVYRDARRQPSGFLAQIELHSASADDLQADPATAAAWRYLQQHAPLRAGERATLFRFWMARDTYQAVSAVQSLIFVNIALYYLNTPALAFTFFPCAAPTFWEPPFAYMDLQRLVEADWESDGRRYGVFGHDWRVRPPIQWLDLLAERELAATPLDVDMPTTVPLVVLGEAEFEQAVRDALHNVTTGDGLRANPLLRSRLVVDQTGVQASETERIRTLQSLLKHAAETLQSTPRTLKWYRALYHTYLQPAATQEQAAELLNVPFSSYRRHLKAAITHVTTMLWQAEMHGQEIEHKVSSE
jgi:hypothetical protein